MAEPTSGTPVIDRRTEPRGVLPRHTQTWLMAGLAAVILAIIVFSGRPMPPDRPAALPAQPRAPSPDRLRDYQDRLRQLDERTRQQMAEPPPPAFPPDPRALEPRREPPIDPLREERQRLAYDSLFSSNVVATSRKSLLATAQSRTGRTASASQPDALVPPAPSLDDVAAAVLRASARPSDEPAPDQKAIEGAVPPKRPQVAKADDPAPASPYRLLEGTVIDTVLLNRLDGSRAAPVSCLVTNPVYSHDRQAVLIPAGARVLGETTPVQAQGEPRLAVTFDRLLFSDGRSVALTNTTGLNQRGDAGLAGEVNHHFARTFGLSGAVGLISGLAQWFGARGADIGGTSRTVIVTDSANSSAQAAAQIASQFLNRAPTVTIREGHRVKVYLTADLDLPAYAPASKGNP